MVRPLNLVANPLRLLLLLAVLMTAVLLVGLGVSQPPIHQAGSHSQPATELGAAPNAGSQPAVETVANQSASTTTRIVNRSPQGPAVSAPPAAAAPVQEAPAGGQGCATNPPAPAGRGIPAACSNP